MDAALQSLSLAAGDELLTTTHVYNAIRQAMRRTAAFAKGTYREIELPLPVASSQQIVERDAYLGLERAPGVDRRRDARVSRGPDRCVRWLLGRQWERDEGEGYEAHSSYHHDLYRRLRME